MEAGSNIRFDHVVRLSERLQTMRPNPLSRPARLIGVNISTGREITLVSNDLDSPAAVIAELYKTRWQVELFFEWIKQNLSLSHFLGASRNAVTIQIMAALIVYLLLRIAQKAAGAVLSLQAIARLIQPLALVRRPIADLFFPTPPPIQNQSSQLTLGLKYA